MDELIRSAIESISNAGVISLFVAAGALAVVIGGLIAIRRSFAQPTYQSALAYGAAGLFACFLLLVTSQAFYTLEMGLEQRSIARAPIEHRPELLANIERKAMASTYFAFLGTALALPMSFFLFGRALYLRRTDEHDHPHRGAPMRISGS